LRMSGRRMAACVATDELSRVRVERRAEADNSAVDGPR
jgi:hypothetical protein